MAFMTGIHLPCCAAVWALHKVSSKFIAKYHNFITMPQRKETKVYTVRRLKYAVRHAQCEALDGLKASRTKPQSFAALGFVYHLVGVPCIEILDK